MARARFSLKAADLLNTGPWIAEDEPVFGKALNGELAREALYNRVRPPEVHVVECLNQGISCCADRIRLRQRHSESSRQRLRLFRSPGTLPDTRAGRMRAVFVVTSISSHECGLVY